MMKSVISIFKIGLLLCLAGIALFSCADDDPTLTRFQQALVVEIIAGPKNAATLLNNEFFTFEWRAVGSGGDITFTIQLSSVDPDPITTTEVSRSYPGLSEGSYTFTLTARAGSETATDSRTFDIGPNLGSPEVTILGARGSASSGGSGVMPAYAPGQTAFVKWSGRDSDRFGQVSGYRWRISDSDAFNEFNMATIAGFDVPTIPGIYTFTLEAIDNVGAVGSATFDYEVKDATILILDDRPQGDILDEIDEDKFYASIFEGFAFARWDISEQGAPTVADLAPYAVTVVYSDGGSAMWRAIGTDYPEAPVPLSDYIDGGGKLWAMGQGIMEDIAQTPGHANPPDAPEFEVVYLHLAPATGDSATDAGLNWSRAGTFSGDLQFSFADDVLGDPDNFPRITIQATPGHGDVDEIVAGAGAEIIYTGKGGLGDAIGDVALRFPAGGSGTLLVFQTFPLFENRSIKASLISSKAYAEELMREMGQ